MKKVIPLSLLGLTLLAVAIGLGMFGISGNLPGPSLLYVLVSLILGAGGIVVLYKAGRIDIYKMKFSDIGVPTNSKVLQKNNEMVQEFNETANTKDKLKMLKASTVDSAQGS